MARKANSTSAKSTLAQAKDVDVIEIDGVTFPVRITKLDDGTGGEKIVITKERYDNDEDTRKWCDEHGIVVS